MPSCMGVRVDSELIHTQGRDRAKQWCLNGRTLLCCDVKPGQVDAFAISCQMEYLNATIPPTCWQAFALLSGDGVRADAAQISGAL